MESLVIYHSQFGNTRTLAEIIATALNAKGPARAVSVELVGAALPSCDLIVIGAPTQAHGVSPEMKPFLDSLQAPDLRGKAVAIFDTRLRGPVILWGSAAKAIAQKVHAAGSSLVAPPESFFVTMGKEPRLETGEAERARSWAARLANHVVLTQATA